MQQYGFTGSAQNFSLVVWLVQHCDASVPMPQRYKHFSLTGSEIRLDRLSSQLQNLSLAGAALRRVRINASTRCVLPFGCSSTKVDRLQIAISAAQFGCFSATTCLYHYINSIRFKFNWLSDSLTGSACIFNISASLVSTTTCQYRCSNSMHSCV